MKEWVVLSSLLLLLLVFYFFITFIRTIFSFVYLYVEHRLDSNTKHQGSLWRYIQVGLYEFWVVNLKLVMGWLDWSKPRNLPSDTGIVLLHGFLRSPGDWVRFKRRLQNKIDLPIFNLQLHPTFSPIQSIAENFGEDLKKLEQEHGVKQWILVAHSMGGLIGVYYATHLDTQQQVKQVITLGSPYHGTKVSSLALGNNAKQMHPKAAFVEQLRQDIAKEQHFKLFQIATPYDNIVFPWQSSFTDPQFVTEQYTTKPMGHIALLHSKEVNQKVVEWLLKGRA